MSINEHVKILLEKMAALGAPKMWDIGPKAARAAMRSSIFRHNNEPIGKSEDRTIAGPGGSIALRIYTPLNAKAEILPGLVYFHGGGFVLGDLETHDRLCRALANESGCRTIAVDYRLAPEHRFPAAVEDAYAATLWVAQNAQNLGVDAARLAVGGDSAGGNLATVTAQIAKQQGAPALAYQLLIYPVAQLGSDADTQSMRANAKSYFLERESMAWFTRCYAPDLKDRGDPRLSPLLCTDLAGLPPAYIVTAGHDPLHDEGRDYAAALDKAGVPVTYVDYPGMVHGFFSFRSYIPKAREAVAAAGAALRVALAAKDADGAQAAR